jgi:predicted ATPase
VILIPKGGVIMLTGLRLTNFKSWDDTGQVRLAPLTIFFGRNSSGKSSLIQSLLLMKQTAESLDPGQVLQLGGRETYVDLGTYLDLVKDHDGHHDVGMTFSWQTREPVKLRRGSANSDALETDIFRFFTNIAQESGVLGEIFVQRMDYTIGAAGDRTVGMRRRREDYEITSRGLNLRRRAKVPDHLPDPIKCYGFPDAASAVFQNADFLAELSHQFDELMSSISYVGPLRDRPRRRYQWQGSSPTFVGPRGENTVAAILAARRLNRTIKARGFEENLGYWLKHMGLIERFAVVEIGSGTGLYELRVSVAGSSTGVSVTDVGFGVSQVLPVLVQVFYSTPGTPVILEQPEIHLHPAAQSALGDVLLGAVKDNGTQLIVETHSEHLLHRIQRRIAEEEISKDNVALYFIEAADGRSEIQELKLDEYGNITNWPQDFFGDEIGDLSAMTEAAAERRERHP